MYKTGWKRMGTSFGAFSNKEDTFIYVVMAKIWQVQLKRLCIPLLRSSKDKGKQQLKTTSQT
jgi:hypothetical protein